MVLNSKKLSRRASSGRWSRQQCSHRGARAQQGNDPASKEPTKVTIRMTFNGQTMTATLYDNASARDFTSMLPLDLKIENYSSNEKITYLPQKGRVPAPHRNGLTAPNSNSPFLNTRRYDRE